MDQMQGELEAEYPVLKIELLGINEKGQEAGNANTTAGRDIPWLQDVDADSNGRADVATDLWNVTFRDLVILDGNNVKVGAYNLTEHNLAEGENYSTLKQMLIDAAMVSQKPWTNPVLPLDVDDNGLVIPLDVLLVINVLNDVGPYQLPPPTTADAPPPYYDTNGDGLIAPSDALQVINYLNGLVPFEAEGEASPALLPPAFRPVDGSTADAVRLARIEPASTESADDAAIDDAARTQAADLVFAQDDLAVSPSAAQDSHQFDWLDPLEIEW